MKFKLKMKFKLWNYIVLPILVIVMVALIVGDCLCVKNAGAITNLLCGAGLKFDGDDVQQALNESDKLVQQIGEESIVLLKNQGGNDGKGVLPLDSSVKNVNLFGWSSTDAGFLLTGGGSGAATIMAEKRVTLKDALTFGDSRFAVNETLLNDYKAFCDRRFDYQGVLNEDTVTLVEPPKSWYTEERIQQAKNFSDTAVITISRWASENMEIPFVQNKYKAETDRSRTYLQISKEEEDLIDVVTENFENVIVLINTCNSMEMGFLDNEKIDAALLVGMLGQSGTHGIRKILRGEANPSARTVDTYPYDHKSNPSYANALRNADHIHYVENIYVGYRWYETAYAEKLIMEAHGKTYDYSTEEGYKAVVQYPFGYGLSYTTFEWEVTSAVWISGENENELENASIANKKASFKITLDVTNTGNVEGMDVIQLYYTPPYIKGGIEKAAVNMVAYAKTAILKPGATQRDIELTFDLYDMASYDCYDKNGNKVTTYELDEGDYYLRLMNNSHEINACEGAEIKFNLPNKITYKLDPRTKQIVKNRFTGASAYGGASIDGQNAGSPVTYLSREKFGETFPLWGTTPRGGDTVSSANSFVYKGYDNNEKYTAQPVQGQDYGENNYYIWKRKDGKKATVGDLKGESGVELELNEELVTKLGTNYKAAEWEQLLNQITTAELFCLVEDSGYRNYEMTSIGKAHNLDYDGPSGLQMNVGTPEWMDQGKWTGFGGQMNLAQTFNSLLAFQMGRTIGNEATVTGISGWYAPGANLHRTPYNGRYFEYYSEDTLLTGELAAYVIKGAASANVYCFLKHFALSEMGINPRNLNVWTTEQALRETYLRPFEIAVKKGNANAMMTAFNRVGATWAGGNRALLTDVLRTEWGFRGAVITDWSDGDSYMSPHQGVRAGNNMWLNPNRGQNNAKLSRSSNVDVNLARDAAHNMLYTICNTYVQHKNYNPADGEFSVNVGIREKDTVFAWWIPVLVTVNVVIFGISIFEITWMCIKARKAYNKENGGAAQGGEQEQKTE